MAKEFDIYLNRRLTECDILVYSIPYYDSLTVRERLILNSCIRQYTLIKYVAAESDLELRSHIDKMIKVCREKLNESAVVSSKVKGTQKKAFFVALPGMVVDSADFDLFYRIYNKASTKMTVESNIHDIDLHLSMGGGSSGLTIDSGEIAAELTKYEVAKPKVVVSSQVRNALSLLIEPKPNATVIGFSATEVLRRHRLLLETDPDTLGHYDEWELEDVDFITK